MPEVLPPPLLLTEPISTSCSFVSVCLCSKALISHIQFTDSFVPSTMKCQCPEKSFSTPFGNFSFIIGHFLTSLCSCRPEKVCLHRLLFLWHDLYVYATQNVNGGDNALVAPSHVSGTCLRYYFISAAIALKRNSAQRENCSLTAVSSLTVFAAITHIKTTIYA